MQKLTFIGIAALAAVLLAFAPTALAGGSKAATGSSSEATAPLRARGN